MRRSMRNRIVIWCLGVISASSLIGCGTMSPFEQGCYGPITDPSTPPIRACHCRSYDSPLKLAEIASKMDKDRNRGEEITIVKFTDNERKPDSTVKDERDPTSGRVLDMCKAIEKRDAAAQAPPAKPMEKTADVKVKKSEPIIQAAAEIEAPANTR